LRQIIQLPNRVQILREARRLEFRIGLAEIVAGELRVRLLARTWASAFTFEKMAAFVYFVMS
jgi:hypothetical protein